jgi:hypothetical protein
VLDELGPEDRLSRRDKVCSTYHLENYDQSVLSRTDVKFTSYTE